MINRFNGGFTLIELLVVIAIIGILSSVVLASLNTARGKGANAAVKANLANIRAQTEISYDNNNASYSIVCADTVIVAARTAADSAGGGAASAAGAVNKCFGQATQWVITAGLKVTEGANVAWCIDAAGSSKGVTLAQFNAIAAGSQCP